MSCLKNNGNKPCDVQNCKDQSTLFDPILWNEYFNVRDDIALEVETFRIYRRGVQGPLLFLLHGGGFSALTWSLLSASITEQVHCQCLAVDLRGHGDTKCQNNEDLSIDTLAKDVIKIIFAMYPTEAPPIILIGHSMGGAVAIHVAHQRKIPSLAGLAVIDVVEGSAINALSSMANVLENRPKSFTSLSQAIEWSVRSSQLRNLQSARVSFPGQLKRIDTNQTATSELDSGVALIHTDSTTRSLQKRDKSASKSTHHPVIMSRLETTMETRAFEEDKGPVHPVDVHSPPTTSSDAESDGSKIAALRDKRQSTAEYTWRIDLMKTQSFWNGWFSGLSKMFLSIPEPKLLLLAGTDRLDRELTIGQMQGRFQLSLFPKAGHAVHEDLPDKVTECLVRFLVRNRITEPLSNCVK